MNTITTEILANAADVELEDWGPLEEATGDPMATHGLEMWVDGDKSAGHLAVHAWTFVLGPGGERGHLPLVRSDDGDPGRGEPADVGTGDIAVYPTGWKGTWDIHETVRKVYSIF